MSNNIYIVNFQILVQSVILRVYRLPIVLSWLGSFITPIMQQYTEWRLYYADRKYNLEHNSQVCRLRKLLNDYFDPALRRISIEDGIYYLRPYVFLEPEDKPLYLNQNVYIMTQPEYDSGHDFVVKLNGCTVSQSQEQMMKNRINYYKLAGKRYIIEP